ncbi:hypothetical protein T07_11895 [Trichinella nelsoni]|uniref:Uncharacterized protein n=1 Tax=Trichinella nelsoni TaxID=6336 RepID=A0A0V0RV38_9BILA|nr:hypothetical protein T07_11895 [Trichinella nelsoni]
MLQNVKFVISYFDGRHKRRCANTHKCHINIAITKTCIKQPFTISCMLKFICMLNAKQQSRSALSSSLQYHIQFQSK